MATLARGFAVLLFLFLLLVPAAPAAGQEIAVGERVRVELRGEESREGVLRAASADTLWLRAGDGAERAFAQRDVTALFVRRRESRPESAWRWAKRGFLAGALLGVGWCLADSGSCTLDGTDSGRRDGFVLSALWLGSAGFTYGGIGGALFPGARWARVLRLPEPGG